jgi:hypothetical protein
MACAVITDENKDQDLGRLIDRILRSISRADAIITDLLNFARAGGTADPGARTDVREVIADLVTPMTQQAEQAQIELRFDQIPPVLVACDPGVYLSLVGNLVRNAIKYMGNGDTRHITVRVVDQGSRVRTEVIDTGARATTVALKWARRPSGRTIGPRAQARFTDRIPSGIAIDEEDALLEPLGRHDQHVTLDVAKDIACHRAQKNVGHAAVAVSSENEKICSRARRYLWDHVSR